MGPKSKTIERMKKRDGAPAGRGWYELLGQQVVQLVDALADPGVVHKVFFELSYQASFGHLFSIFGDACDYLLKGQENHRTLALFGWPLQAT